MYSSSLACLYHQGSQTVHPLMHFSILACIVPCLGCICQSRNRSGIRVILKVAIPATNCSVEMIVMGKEKRAESTKFKYQVHSFLAIPRSCLCCEWYNMDFSLMPASSVLSLLSIWNPAVCQNEKVRVNSSRWCMLALNLQMLVTCEAVPLSATSVICATCLD